VCVGVRLRLKIILAYGAGTEMKKSKLVIPIERIEKSILLIRGQKVMLDRDLADLYGVETKVLKQAVRRNITRFPEDFMFELAEDENRALRSQNVTLKRGQHSKYLPFAFTEQGVAMLSSVLNSKRAIEVNILIMRAFVRLREMVSSHKDLLRKVEEMEKKYDHQFQVVFEAIKQLIETNDKPRRKIGFEVKEPKAKYTKSKKAV
jgi:phage regulator Rha-like protein